MATFFIDPQSFFLNKLINFKFQKIITFLQKIFFDGTFYILLLKRWQIIKKIKKIGAGGGPVFPLVVNYQKKTLGDDKKSCHR